LELEEGRGVNEKDFVKAELVEQLFGNAVELNEDEFVDEGTNCKLPSASIVSYRSSQ
jgi:hypothetical protein